MYNVFKVFVIFPPEIAFVCLKMSMRAEIFVALRNVR